MMYVWIDQPSRSQPLHRHHGARGWYDGRTGMFYAADGWAMQVPVEVARVALRPAEMVQRANGEPLLCEGDYKKWQKSLTLWEQGV